MATAIDENVVRVRRPELLNKIDIEVNINDALLLATEEGLLTALDDRYIFLDYKYYLSNKTIYI
jgi:hypothetical protein